MRPYYADDFVTLYHGDCREIAPSLCGIGAVVTDPPYGIDWVPRVNHVGADHLWRDTEMFDPVPWLGIGSFHLFWGAQYFANKLPTSESWLSWVKRPIHLDFSRDTRTYATVELAWTDFGCKAAFFSLVWDGGLRAGNSQNRAFSHPSQKPLELMSWCLDLLPSGCDGHILDPFAGSGTTLRAAKDRALTVIGIEREERYCEVAAERCGQQVLDLGGAA